MKDCIFCNGIQRPIIKESTHAFAYVDNYFREGHCTVAVKKHKKSISEMTAEEATDVFGLIREISAALEEIFLCEKTYLLSIGDQMEHLHFHLIPKHKDLCSMGVYCFGKLFEAEGEMSKTESENRELKEKIVELLSIER